MRSREIAKEPLIHFLALGAILFAIVSAATPDEDEDRIVVDRPALLTYTQYRSKAFDAEAAASLLDAMPSDERKQLIDDFIREEALYREAKRLGAEEGDYVIRQRMVQKLEFMAEAAAPPIEANIKLLEDYYASNKEAYYQPAEITFSHIFISTDGRSTEEAHKIADDLLARVQSNDAGFTDASQYGDRFLYNVNYVDRSFDYVKSHFGEMMARELFSEAEPLDRWGGPLDSDHGVHLVYVASRKPGVTPPFEAISARIAADYVQEQQQAEAEKVISAIVEYYKPVIKLDGAASSQQQAGGGK